MAAHWVPLGFGSKSPRRKKQNLADNGYASHREWFRYGREARSDEFFVLCSRDEMAGCQPCIETLAYVGTLTLRLRLPDSLASRPGKYITIEDVPFA